mmetsp:Transcript_88462/g.249313  ORF Transcript_88462/g.249313 Transcript_88462/m.249313 type:complete len:307 (+) Transcript_88462:106-1026(+)
MRRGRGSVSRCASEPPRGQPPQRTAAGIAAADHGGRGSAPPGSYADQLRRQIDEKRRLQLEEQQRYAGVDHSDHHVGRKAPFEGQAQRGREQVVQDREESYRKWMQANNGGGRQSLATMPPKMQEMQGQDLSMSMRVEASTSPPGTPNGANRGAHRAGPAGVLSPLPHSQLAGHSVGSFPPAMPANAKPAAKQNTRHGSLPPGHRGHAREPSPHIVVAQAMLGGTAPAEPMVGGRSPQALAPAPRPPRGPNNCEDQRPVLHGPQEDALSMLMASHDAGRHASAHGQPNTSVVVSQPPGGRSSFSFR